MKKKLTAAKLRNELIATFREYGFKVDDKENTPGARKVWMSRHLDSDEYFLPETLLEILAKWKPKLVDGEAIATGFEAKLQYYDPQVTTVFIAVYNKDRYGLEYCMGVDC